VIDSDPPPSYIAVEGSGEQKSKSFFLFGWSARACLAEMDLINSHTMAVLQHLLKLMNGFKMKRSQTWEILPEYARRNGKSAIAARPLG
jgi:hypothetical protein